MIICTRKATENLWRFTETFLWYKGCILFICYCFFFFGARLKLSDTFLLINTVNVSCQKQSILLKWRMMYLMLMKIKQEKRRKNMKCKWQCLIATNVVTKTFICGFVDFIFKQELVARIVCHPEGNMIFHRIHWLVKKVFHKRVI